MTASHDSVTRPSRLALALRVLVLAAAALGVMGFDSCDDDPLLDSGGGTGCAGSHCSARILPDSAPNPARF